MAYSTWRPDVAQLDAVPSDRRRWDARSIRTRSVAGGCWRGLTSRVSSPHRVPGRARTDRARTLFQRVAGRSAAPQPARRDAPHRVLAEGGLERVYADRSLPCRDCNEEFVFSSGEQAFYASKGLINDPQRCPTCRAAAKRARSAEGPREFHAAICGACGGQAVVPFAPRSDRPVYCSSCFDKVRAGTLGPSPAHA